MSEKRYATTFQWAQGEYGVAKFLDAEQALPFRVTEAHCKVAVRKDANGCPIQVAVREQEGGNTPELVDVVVIRSTAMVVYLDSNGDGVGVRYRVEGPARDAVQTYDRSGVYVPGEYALYPVQPSARMGMPRTRGTERGPHTTASKHLTRPLPGLRVGIKAKNGE